MGQIEITLKKYQNSINLIIQDNGKGFQTDKELDGNQGMGLSTMKERAELLGGSFSIESTPGLGTILNIMIT